MLRGAGLQLSDIAPKTHHLSQEACLYYALDTQDAPVAHGPFMKDEEARIIGIDNQRPLLDGRIIVAWGAAETLSPLARFTVREQLYRQFLQSKPPAEATQAGLREHEAIREAIEQEMGSEDWLALVRKSFSDMSLQLVQAGTHQERMSNLLKKSKVRIVEPPILSVNADPDNATISDKKLKTLAREVGGPFSGTLSDNISAEAFFTKLRARLTTMALTGENALAALQFLCVGELKSVVDMERASTYPNFNSVWVSLQQIAAKKTDSKVMRNLVQNLIETDVPSLPAAALHQIMTATPHITGGFDREKVYLTINTMLDGILAWCKRLWPQHYTEVENAIIDSNRALEHEIKKAAPLAPSPELLSYFAPQTSARRAFSEHIPNFHRSSQSQPRSAHVMSNDVGWPGSWPGDRVPGASEGEPELESMPAAVHPSAASPFRARPIDPETREWQSLQTRTFEDIRREVNRGRTSERASERAHASSLEAQRGTTKRQLRGPSGAVYGIPASEYRRDPMLAVQPVEMLESGMTVSVEAGRATEDMNAPKNWEQDYKSNWASEGGRRQRPSQDWREDRVNDRMYGGQNWRGDQHSRDLRNEGPSQMDQQPWRRSPGCFLCGKLSHFRNKCDEFDQATRLTPQVCRLCMGYHDTRFCYLERTGRQAGRQSRFNHSQ